MIPQLPANVPLTEKLMFFENVLSNIEHLSQGHIHWYTHKNPFGCWICDLLDLERNTIYMAKSLLDNMNDISRLDQDPLSRECEL